MKFKSVYLLLVIFTGSALYGAQGASGSAAYGSPVTNATVVYNSQDAGKKHFASQAVADMQDTVASLKRVKPNNGQVNSAAGLPQTASAQQNSTQTSRAKVWSLTDSANCEKCHDHLFHPELRPCLIHTCAKAAQLSAARAFGLGVGVTTPPAETKAQAEKNESSKSHADIPEKPAQYLSWTAEQERAFQEVQIYQILRKAIERKLVAEIVGTGSDASTAAQKYPYYHQDSAQIVWLSKQEMDCLQNKNLHIF